LGKDVLVRASIGTLAVLKLVDLKSVEPPTIAYLLQYSQTGCRANCRFCLQSRGYGSGERLGRITWPPISLSELTRNWVRVFKRVCLQTIIKPGFTEEALEILATIRSIDSETPISLAITPAPKSYLKEARALEVDSLGVGLDVATPELFGKWGKPYSWSVYWGFIEDAIGVYGRGNVYVHLIAGLGESLRELVGVMKRVYGLGGRVALFNYTDQRGSSPVDIKYYRLAQLARYLLEHGLDPDSYIDYEHGLVGKSVPLDDLEEAFYTSGCPDCNRPFYNESPRGPLYNIPSKRLLEAYREKLRVELESIGVVV